MAEKPRIILSAFGDEGANTRSAVEQMAVLAALGLKYYSPRFVDIDATGDIKHVVDLDEAAWKKMSKLQDEYGLSVTSIGSRIGKVKLRDVEDGSHNKYVDPQAYLNDEVAKTINAGKALGAKLIRGFSFYHPQTESPDAYISEAVDRLGPIVEQCAAAGMIYGLEVEANLIGQNGRLLAELARQVKSPHMVCIFDGGNLSTQNMSPVECYAEYEAMREAIGWIHIKDYRIDPTLVWTGVVDEDRLKNFVPSDIGDSGHEAILRDLAVHLPKMNAKMSQLGVKGVFLELEPHLKGGGQFGGFSGPDGMGVAVRSLCRLLDYVGIDYDLRTMKDIVEARGF
ncbi:sugar phosphate isomerase/epimerase family protein [Rubinisphaera brasiliensis]|uniref:Xylose isomerase domain-containing protein TIM barrel n=1 Tax=Rubinisphaera brasiliensis (strain ATCC 49424 / DSM 5305 / JCM 21570 / IAM 15109 / NBRC 103401 / IFAM 1448) TaxID=756272 RepID=F0SNP5_RUBBR|nr:TIM barrel protein [Rubinisphaera brasiliensis]ADY58931.1 Xylose isomerase domain-containing protein TIM barrel [Rubinisphaera brasiliensis DSM 5305]